MAGKNCPDCGGFLKQGRFSIFRCTKCENRHWYRRLWRWCEDRWAKATSAVKSHWASIRKGIGTYWPLLIVAALFLAILLVGLRGKSELEPLQARVTQLEETVADLEKTADRLEESADRIETSVQNIEESLTRIEERVTRLEESVSRLESEVEELQRLVEELQKQAASPETKVTVKQGDTVWDLLTQELGRYPTWEEIQKVVDANNLGNFMDGQGRWIVLIYPGQVLDLTPAFGG